MAHDDSLTCIALGTYRAAAGATSMTAGATVPVPMHFLASCSADCTVKVWSVKEHVVSLQAALELYDLEQPASCCDLLFTHERSTAYCGLLAAGADDGGRGEAGGQGADTTHGGGAVQPEDSDWQRERRAVCQVSDQQKIAGEYEGWRAAVSRYEGCGDVCDHPGRVCSGNGGDVQARYTCGRCRLQ